MGPSSPEPEIISPEAAAALLWPEVERLQAEGWILMVHHDYMARLTRGDKNLDLQVDLLGQLIREEKPLSLEQENSQMIALALALAGGLIVFTLATILGLFG
jgi:hypothetical protein